MSKEETTTVTPTGAVMNTPSELTTFKNDEEAYKFFYLFENVLTKNLPDSERAEKIVA